MAVISTKVASALKLIMQTGIDENGKDKFITKTMSNIKVDALDEDVFAVGKLISDMKTFPLFGLDRQDQYSLTSN
ncbi:MAG: DUF1659 domain-containing protein [Clostridium sp.]|uniref:DUF1659 domain-containing protein n=1 Tax=Clostridium sp. TaxID=1506 RepID=UPI003D6D07E4